MGEICIVTEFGLNEGCFIRRRGIGRFPADVLEHICFGGDADTFAEYLAEIIAAGIPAELGYCLDRIFAGEKICPCLTQTYH